MIEAMNGIPEAMRMWKPRAKPMSREEAAAKIDESAEFRRDLLESIDRFFEKSARKAETEKPKATVPGLFLLLLCAILTAGAEYVIDGKEKS
jgi:hypothetical protein